MAVTTSHHMSSARNRRCMAAVVLIAGVGQSMTAQANNVVSACSGVSLPKSVITQTLGDVLVPVLQPVETILSALTLGTVNLGLSSTLASAAAGQPINLKVLDINGNAIDVATDPICETTSDSFSMKTPKGLSFGGNKITGLGSPGLEASAGALDAIAIGDLANTSVGAAGAVAIGRGASVTHAGSVALGAGSLATGATLNLPAFLLNGTATAEVNIGNRRLTGVAPGAANTDAVNVAQLKVVNDALGTLSANAVQYDSASKTQVTLQGAGGTTISNVKAGAVNATSTDAVNGSQLHATNVQLAYNTTNITDLQEGRAGFLRVNNSSNYAKPVVSGVDSMAAGAGAVATGSQSLALGTQAQALAGSSVALGAGSVANGMTLGNQAYMVGGTATGEVNIGGRRITGVAAGSNATDAVNVAQLQAVNDSIGTLSGNAVQYDSAAKTAVTLQGVGGTTISNVKAGALSTTSTEAVNGSQLHATNVQLDYNTTNITDLQEGRAGFLRVNNSSNYAKPVASGLDSMAAGAGSVASGDESLALGTQAQATAASSVALGAGSIADGLTLGNQAYLVGGTASGEVNVGGRRITGVAAGSNATDAVNVAQLQAVNDSIGTLAGNAVQYDSAAKTQITLQGVGGTTISNVKAGALSETSTEAVNGSQLHATNVQLSYNTTNITDLQEGRAGFLRVNNSSNYAKPVASGLDSMAAGAGSVASGDESLALGTQAQATAASSVALGAGSIADGLTLGNQAYLVGGTASGEVNVGGRRITGVAAGSNATDAVNVAQLQAVNDSIGTLAGNAVQYDSATKTQITLQGVGGTTISNVKAGALSETSTEAVNGSQLHATNVQLSYNTTNITDLQEGRAGFLRVNNSSNYAKPVASGLDSMAAGAGSVASGDESLALGTQAQATAASSVALGAGSIADGLTLGNQAYLVGGTATGEVNVGGRRITGVAAGSSATDAVNVAQLQAVSDSIGTLSGNAVQYDSATKTLVTLQGVGGTRISNVAAGAVSATSTDAVNGAQLHATNSIVSQHSLAISQLSYDLALLNDLAVKYQDATKSAITLGGANGTTIHNVAPGVAGTDGVNRSQLDGAIGAIPPQDALLYDPAAQAYNASRGGVDQKIVGVAAGQLSADSSDAVNGAQLYATNVQVTNNHTAITDLQEGRAGYLQVNNSANHPKPVASGTDSMAAGAGAVASGTNSIALGTQAQAYASNSVALGYGSVADRASTVSFGSAGSERVLTHVADGVLATDAVNLRQLQGSMGRAIDIANAYTDVRFDLLSQSLSNLRRDADGGTAAAMAIAGIPSFSDPGGGAMGIGVSTWQGQHAIAMGLSKTSDNGRIIIRASAAYNSRNQGGANAGMGFAF